MATIMRNYRALFLAVLLLVAVAVALSQRTTAFGRPAALVGLVTVSMWLLLLGYNARWREAARRRFAEPELLRRMGDPALTPALLLRGLLLSAALVLVLLAVARPKGGLGRQTLTGEGIDLILCLDVSNSMRVADMGGVPRLVVAKQFLRQFVESSESDRIRLVAFAGSAHVMCPFTLDHNTLTTFIEDLDYGSVAKQGTALGSALQTSLARFDPQRDTGRAIVLLTDGEDQGSDPLGAAEACRQMGVRVYTVGLGTASGGLIPMGNDWIGNQVYKRFQGSEVTSALDEPTLMRVSEATEGRYFRADSLRRLDEVLAALSQLDKRAVTTHQVELREDVFTWYLVPAFVLLALEPLVLLRRRRGSIG